MAKTYNLFISHSWSYGDAYDKLVQLLYARGYFPFKNYSVPKDNPIHNAPNAKALHAAITTQIKPASAVLIMAGMYTHYSKWINHEIEIAKKGFLYPKPVIAIRPWAQEKVPQIIQEHADAIVGWNTESIVAAIRKHG